MGNTFGVGVGLGVGLSVGAAALMQAAAPSIEPQKRSSEADANRVVTLQHQHKAEDIDESSAEGLRDAMSYAKDNPMLIQVPVSNVWIGSNGSVKLRGVSFTSWGFGIHRVREDYKRLYRFLMLLIGISGGDVTKLPPDYKKFLVLLRSDNLTMEDEFFIVNNAALLPMENRTEVFLMLHDRIVNYLGRTNPTKRKRILSKLPYKNNWLDTAKANVKINQWVVDVKNVYRRSPLDLLRLNRNIRCHMHEYSNDDFEETLYYEWPELLMVMEKMLYLEGELKGTGIHNKFG
ncbi:unnamed protein product [Urochloa humidicola]